MIGFVSACPRVSKMSWTTADNNWMKCFWACGLEDFWQLSGPDTGYPVIRTTGLRCWRMRTGTLHFLLYVSQLLGSGQQVITI